MSEVLVGKVCSGGLFEKVEVKEEWEVGSLRRKIADVVRRTSTVRELPIIAHGWQVEMAAGMLEKRDSLCITKTGDGKTYCFLIAAMFDPSLIFIVVSPLISLMHDQVSKTQEKKVMPNSPQVRVARSCGIKAVSLCSENLHKDPKIAQRAVAGEYQLIFIAPEMLSMDSSSSIFKRLVSSKVVHGRLGGVIIDEAHLCHQW